MYPDDEITTITLDGEETTTISTDINEATETYPLQTSWTEWSKWSECSVPCGKGKKTRHRKCRIEDINTFTEGKVSALSQYD